MKKTKKYTQQQLDIYQEGRRAAQDNEPRFSPYSTVNRVQTWFAGYDSVRKTLDK
jgi:hypothetical protein